MGRKLLPSVTSYRSSPPAGSCRPITARHHWSAARCRRLSPPPVPSLPRHHPHGTARTAYHRFRLDGDGELHAYRWSSVFLTDHHLDSRLDLV